MNILDAKRYIRNIIEKQVPVTVAMVGPSGIGKSAIERQLSKEMSEFFKTVFGFIDLRLATQEPSDLIGIPYQKCTPECRVVTDKSGNTAVIHGQHETHWAIPSWFPKPGTRGVICLEELNRAPNDVRQCIFQFIWDRELHQSKLPEGWTIVLAMNPETDDGSYQVETLDKALVRRCSVVVVEPNVNAWMDWATTLGNVPPEITGFIGTHKDMLFEPETFDFPVKRTPAGWGDTLSLLFKAKAIPQDLEFEIIAGILGKEAATAFIKYMDKNYERPVNGEEVLEDYGSVKDKIKKQSKKAEEMYVTIKQIVGIAEKSNKRLTKSQLKNLIDFIDDIPADTGAMLVHELPSEIVTALTEIDDRILKIGKASRAAREEK
jgi:AAA domain (dynein-related subfamily)